MVSATAQPKHPTAKVMVEMKKHIRRPNMSEKRPYSGWNAVLVIRYDVVNQAALLAALKSEPMAAYVEAVIVPSNPERNTLAHKAVGLRSQYRVRRQVCALSLRLSLTRLDQPEAW